MANVSLKILEFREIQSREKHDIQSDLQIDYLLWYLQYMRTFILAWMWKMEILFWYFEISEFWCKTNQLAIYTPAYTFTKPTGFKGRDERD